MGGVCIFWTAYPYPNKDEVFGILMSKALDWYVCMGPIGGVSIKKLGD